MGVIAMKEKIIGTIFSVLVISALFLAGGAKAVSSSISNIQDTNKGQTINFNVNFTGQATSGTLTIESLGAKLDIIKCEIASDGSYQCTRSQGSLNNPKPYNDILINEILNPGFGYDPGSTLYGIQWNTPTSLQPGSYKATFTAMINGNPVTESDTFNIITPAKPK